MKEAIRDYCRVGIIHLMAYPGVARGEQPLMETLREVVEDDYFSAVELGPLANDQEREQARDLLARSGFKVAFGAQGILRSKQLDLTAEEEDERSQAVEAVCRGIDEATALGASSCGVLAGKDPGPLNREMAKARLVDSLGAICRYAASKGNIVIELEQFGSYEPRRAAGGESRASAGRRDFEADKVPFLEHSLIGPTQEAVEIAQELRRHHRYFGLLIDLSHLPLLDEKPRRAVNIAGEFLAHAHIGNCVRRDPCHPAYGDQHPVFGIPGGENDVPEIREFLVGLMDIGFLCEAGQRILSFEVKPFGNQTTKEVVTICKAKLDEAWRRL